MKVSNTQALINSATPSCWSYFRSFYYPATFISPINLNRVVKEHECKDEKTIQAAQRIASLPQVQEILSEPLSYDLDQVQKKNEILQNHGFRLLARKFFHTVDGGCKSFPFYSVSEHPDLPGWIVKAAGYRVPKDRVLMGISNDHNETSQFTFFESFLRLSMNQRIRQIAKRLKIDLVVPKEYAVPYPCLASGDISQRYFIISEKLNITNENETAAQIAKMNLEQQIELARKVSLLIKHIGFADASFDNIRFTVDGRLALIDTEPAGLLVAKQDPVYAKGHSVEKCARLGLYTFKSVLENHKLIAVSKEVNRHYQKSLRSLSITKIFLSVVCPLIPLVYLVIAVVNRMRISHNVSRIVRDDIHYKKVIEKLDLHALQDAWNKYLLKTKSLRDQFYAAIDGVPFAMKL